MAAWLIVLTIILSFFAAYAIMLERMIHTYKASPGEYVGDWEDDGV